MITSQLLPTPLLPLLSAIRRVEALRYRPGERDDSKRLAICLHREYYRTLYVYLPPRALRPGYFHPLEHDPMM